MMDYLSIAAFMLIVGFGGDPPKGSPLVPPAAQSTDFDTAYRCDYSESFDQNYDNWPDYWIRHTGPRYPLYVKAEIVGEPSPEAARCLRVFLDGGSFAATSPKFPVSSLFSYQVNVWVKTRGIVNDRVWVSYVVLDAHDKPLATFRSQPLGETPSWTLLQLGPFEVDVPAASKAVVELHVEADVNRDVKAEVWFGNVHVHRMPSLRVVLDQPLGLYRLPTRPVVNCHLSGVRSADTPLRITILNAEGKTVHDVELHPKYEKVETAVASAESAIHSQQVFSSQVQWQPDPLTPGFYWLVARIPWKDDAFRETRIPFVLMEAVPGSTSAFFGWSLPQGLEPLGARRLAELITESGVGWIKFPVWYDEQTSPGVLQDVPVLLDRLSNHGVKIIGVLIPPQSVREALGPIAPSHTAGVFLRDQKVWEPSLTLSFVKMASLVPFWQIGGDNEHISANDPSLQKSFVQLKNALGQVVADIRLGVPWRWLEPPPKANIGFISLSEEPPLTAAELENYLARQSIASEKVFLLVELKPLSRQDYSIGLRVQDLVLRMASVRRASNVIGFHPNPFDPDCGLFYPNGAPAELYLPWRTTIHAIGEGECLGSVALPAGSSNLIFARDDEGVMIVWNNRTVRENVYLGEDIRVTDVWGTTLPYQGGPQGQSFLVDEWPRFVHGVSIPIARWRQEANIAVTRLPSIYGVPHRNKIRWQNTFDRAVSGEVTIVTKPGWRVTPQRFPFHLTPGEKVERDFVITLPFDAEAGPQPVRLDFRVGTDQFTEFSSYHFIEVGMGDVYVEITTRLDESGDLIVQQVLVNDTPETVSFRCELFVPDRRRQFCLIQGQAPGRHVQTYRFPRGEELIGKTLWLRAEEIGGSRILNYRVIATR